MNNRVLGLMTILACLFWVTACSSSSQLQQVNKIPEQMEKYGQINKPDLDDQISLDAFILNGGVCFYEGSYRNLDRLTGFIHDVQEGNPSTVTSCYLVDDQSPVLTYLSYDGGEIEVCIDESSTKGLLLGGSYENITYRRDGDIEQIVLEKDQDELVVFQVNLQSVSKRVPTMTLLADGKDYLAKSGTSSWTHYQGNGVNVDIETDSEGPVNLASLGQAVIIKEDEEVMIIFDRQPESYKIWEVTENSRKLVESSELTDFGLLVQADSDQWIWDHENGLGYRIFEVQAFWPEGNAYYAFRVEQEVDEGIYSRDQAIEYIEDLGYSLGELDVAYIDQEVIEIIDTYNRNKIMLFNYRTGDFQWVFNGYLIEAISFINNEKLKLYSNGEYMAFPDLSGPKEFVYFINEDSEDKFMEVPLSYYLGKSFSFGLKSPSVLEDIAIGFKDIQLKFGPKEGAEVDWYAGSIYAPLIHFGEKNQNLYLEIPDCQLSDQIKAKYSLNTIQGASAVKIEEDDNLIGIWIDLQDGYKFDVDWYELYGEYVAYAVVEVSIVRED